MQSTNHIYIYIIKDATQLNKNNLHDTEYHLKLPSNYTPLRICKTYNTHTHQHITQTNITKY